MPYGVICTAWLLLGNAHSDSAKSSDNGFHSVVQKVLRLRLEQDRGAIGGLKSKAGSDKASADYDWQQVAVSSLPGWHQEPSEPGARADSKPIRDQVQANRPELGKGVSTAILETPQERARTRRVRLIAL
jgi:hypothetical protein